MIQIAICDDEQNIRVYLRKLIDEQNIECEITECESGEEILTYNHEFDLIFLDIVFKTELSGIALAKLIRSREQTKRTIIIFVTGYKEYVFDAFDVEAFHYLLKPILKEKFVEVFNKAVKQITEKIEQQRTIHVQFANTIKVIPVEDILYVESQNHKVILHTQSGIVDYYAKISDLEKELQNQFFRIHKGYLINLSKIDRYCKNEVTLINQVKLPLSKYKYADFVKEYLRFME